MSVDAEGSAYALLIDGATIEIRAARPGDFDAVRDLHAKMSPDNQYLRFFSMSPLAAELEARRVCREPGPDHAALLAVLDGEVVGCGTYERAGTGSRSAEVAFTVADDLQNRGIGMLLLEHLVSLGRGRGFGAFTAETLSENAAMLRVFADAGLQAQRSLSDGVYDLTFPLPADEADAALGTYRDTVAVRERSADVASMRPVLMPASVAVIGASRRPGSVGRVILQNLIDGGFPGPVYPVNPGAAELDGIACLPSAAALPNQVDLAVITVPAAAVLGVAEDCGRRGVRALVVVAAGLSGPARAELLGICRRHGMRMVGPASFGVANPGIGLDATFAARHPVAGTAGLAFQSTGGTGFVLVEHLSRLGVGISSLVSFGDKDDVSGTDMLQWWESDEATKLALLYLESIGNPPKFARTARRVGRTMPVLTVDVGRSATGGRLAGARARKAATPLVTRQALFEQAGIIAALPEQPVPGQRPLPVPRHRAGQHRQLILRPGGLLAGRSGVPVSRAVRGGIGSGPPGRDAAQRGADRDRRYPGRGGDRGLRFPCRGQLPDQLRQLRRQLRRALRPPLSRRQPGQPAAPVPVQPPPQRHHADPERVRDLLLRRRLQLRQLHRRQPAPRLVPALPAERHQAVHPHRPAAAGERLQPHPAGHLGRAVRDPRKRQLRQHARHLRLPEPPSDTP